MLLKNTINSNSGVNQLICEAFCFVGVFSLFILVKSKRNYVKIYHLNAIKLQTPFNNEKFDLYHLLVTRGGIIHSCGDRITVIANVKSQGFNPYSSVVKLCGKIHPGYMLGVVSSSKDATRAPFPGRHSLSISTFTHLPPSPR